MMQLQTLVSDFKEYVQDMARRQRIIVIGKDEENLGWCSYLVGAWNDVDRFHNRKIFSIVQDEDDGPIIYIDYVVSVHWDEEIRNLVYNTLKHKHPSFKFGVWYRPSKGVDRRVVWEVPCRTRSRT